MNVDHFSLFLLQKGIINTTITSKIDIKSSPYRHAISITGLVVLKGDYFTSNTIVLHITKQKMEGRKEFLLKKAEKVLLRSEFDVGCDRNESLVGIYDSIIEILSSQDESSSLSLNKNVCHYRFIAGGGKTTTMTTMTKEDRDAAAADTADKVIGLLNTEANLYRVLWLSCVIIVSITDIKNRTTIDTLQTTIRQCELLIRILKQNIVEATKGNENNNNSDNSSNIWDVRIRELTNNNDSNNDDDDDDDDDEHDEDDESENILSFSREQLEEEEQELLRMASAPIPTSTQCREGKTTHQHQQQQFSQLLPLIKPSRSVVAGSIIPIIPSLPSLSSSPLSIPVELDDRGILRRCNGNDNGDNSWWALTSQSILQELDEGNNNQSSSTKVKITNIISNETAVDEHSSGVSITLDVGRADCLLLWREHLGKVKQYLMKVMEEQKEIKRLWSVDDVMMAQTNAKKSRNL